VVAVCPPLTARQQVLRYTALFAGVTYGWYHRRTLQAAHDEHKLENAVHQREHLIQEAKAAWKRKQEGTQSTREHSTLQKHNVLNHCSHH